MTSIRQLLAELDLRNVDNVARTDSYLELYAWTRAHPPDLPWVLMAHLVSRNAGYLMTDLGRRIAATDDPEARGMMETLFVLLERANFLIFRDAWHHTCLHLLGRSDELAPPRTPAFMCEAWRRYESALAVNGPSPALERALVMDLVHNEQHLIHHRAVHHPDLMRGLELLRLIEASGMERPMVFPWPEPGAAPEIRATNFGAVEARIATGGRIFDTALGERGMREAMFGWAIFHPHTGSRSDHGARGGPPLRELWPVERVRSLYPRVHAEPEPDPGYP